MYLIVGTSSRTYYLTVNLHNRVTTKRDGMEFLRVPREFRAILAMVRNLESRWHKNGHTLLTTLGAQVLKRL